MARQRDFGLRRASLAAVIPLLLGCGTPFGRYWHERGLDARDILDLKYGWSQAVGLKGEVTSFLQTGLGAGGLDYTEWFGRTKVSYQNAFFLHLVVFGGDAVHHFDATSMCFLGINIVAFSLSSEEAPEPMPRFRVGAEVLLPGVLGGAYLNLGEVVDLLAGFLGADIMGDDEPAVIPVEEGEGQNSIGNDSKSSPTE